MGVNLTGGPKVSATGQGLFKLQGSDIEIPENGKDRASTILCVYMDSIDNEIGICEHLERLLL